MNILRHKKRHSENIGMDASRNNSISFQQVSKAILSKHFYAP